LVLSDLPVASRNPAAGPLLQADLQVFSFGQGGFLFDFALLIAYAGTSSSMQLFVVT